MICCHPHHGASEATGEGKGVFARSGKAGFTLLEMCIVLLIIAILCAVSIPAIGTAFNEQGLRQDSHQLALMVKTAMLQAQEQHRSYVIDLTSTSAELHPQGTSAKASADSASDANLFADSGSTTDSAPAQANVEASDTFDAANKLQSPDAGGKADSWVDMPDKTSWVFEPGQLCPATRVRISRGNSWLEMEFNALTGNVETEKTYFP